MAIYLIKGSTSRLKGIEDWFSKRNVKLQK